MSFKNRAQKTGTLNAQMASSERRSSRVLASGTDAVPGRAARSGADAGVRILIRQLVDRDGLRH
jgi:hypothetical protein